MYEYFTFDGKPKPTDDTNVIIATIGSSVTWHLGSNERGNAIRIYEENEETVRKFYENWSKSNG